MQELLEQSNSCSKIQKEIDEEEERKKKAQIDLDEKQRQHELKMKELVQQSLNLNYNEIVSTFQLKKELVSNKNKELFKESNDREDRDKEIVIKKDSSSLKNYIKN